MHFVDVPSPYVSHSTIVFFDTHSCFKTCQKYRYDSLHFRLSSGQRTPSPDDVPASNVHAWSQKMTIASVYTNAHIFKFLKCKFLKTHCFVLF